MNVNVNLMVENVTQTKSEISCECKNPRKHAWKKIYIWNPSTSTCENGKYLASITGDWVVICHEIIEVIKNVPTNTISKNPISTNFNKKKVTCKIENFYILLKFLLITISLLIIISIYCYLKNINQKQGHLLPFYHIANNINKKM